MDHQENVRTDNSRWETHHSSCGAVIRTQLQRIDLALKALREKIRMLEETD
jgi:hypothetical protein